MGCSVEWVDDSAREYRTLYESPIAPIVITSVHVEEDISQTYDDVDPYYTVTIHFEVVKQ